MNGNKRHEARIAVVQTLYALDFNNELKSPPILALKDGAIGKEESLGEEERIYASLLLNGVLERLREIDAIISEYSHNRPLERIDIVDRNVLRLGIYELTWEIDQHAAVIIDECVKLSLEMSNDTSYKFINGILDRYHKDRSGDSSQG